MQLFTCNILQPSKWSSKEKPQNLWNFSSTKLSCDRKCTLTRRDAETYRGKCDADWENQDRRGPHEHFDFTMHRIRRRSSTFTTKLYKIKFLSSSKRHISPAHTEEHLLHITVECLPAQSSCYCGKPLVYLTMCIYYLEDSKFQRLGIRSRSYIEILLF